LLGASPKGEVGLPTPFLYPGGKIAYRKKSYFQISSPGSLGGKKESRISPPKQIHSEKRGMTSCLMKPTIEEVRGKKREGEGDRNP